MKLHLFFSSPNLVHGNLWSSWRKNPRIFQTLLHIIALRFLFFFFYPNRGQASILAQGLATITIISIFALHDRNCVMAGLHRILFTGENAIRAIYATAREVNGLLLTLAYQRFAIFELSIRLETSITGGDKESGGSPIGPLTTPCNNRRR